MKFRKNAKMMMYGALALSLTISFTSCKEDDDVVKSQKTYIYTSNNADGNINYYDVTDLSNVIATNIVTPSELQMAYFMTLHLMLSFKLPGQRLA